jgi:creatinine amidohydrolase/Fe(II)-dependent formamide hydrolase-like protein
MRASRGMGDIAPSKMPKAKTKARRDNTDFTQYAEGGKVAGKKWIQEAIKKPGALRKELGAKPGKPIPAAKLAAAAKKPGKVGKRARLAETLKGMKK